MKIKKTDLEMLRLILSDPRAFAQRNGRMQQSGEPWFDATNEFSYSVGWALSIAERALKAQSRWPGSADKKAQSLG